MSEKHVDLEALVSRQLGNHEVLAPGALDSQIGKTVPVTIEIDGVKKTIGEAVIFKDGEGISASIQINPPESK